MSNVLFKDNRINVKKALNDACETYLLEASGELQSVVARNSRVDTGQLKSSWKYVVEADKGVATIGSPLENAIWEEFGTGIYAENGNGRKSPWMYEDKDGKTWFTRGKKKNPKGLLFSFNFIKHKLIDRASRIYGAMLK